MGWGAARRGRSRRRRAPSGARPRRTRRPGRPPRSRRAGGWRPSGGGAVGGALGGALLGEELLVELERVGELLRKLGLGVDRVDRAGLDARVAVDADPGIDVELLGRIEVAGARLWMDAVHRTHLDAGVVLDAAADDDVGHAATAYKPLKPEPVLGLRPASDWAAARGSPCRSGRGRGAAPQQELADLRGDDDREARA